MPKSFSDLAMPWLFMPRAAYLIIAASLGSLAFAFVLQYGFGYHPCELCLFQRLPFATAALLAALSLIGKPYYGTRTRVFIALCALAFFINAGLASFHTGVERGWWEGTRGCTITPLKGKTPQDWRQEIMSMAVGHCDQISWTFLGLSMANWNVPLSLSLGAFSATSVVVQGRRRKS